MSFIEDVPNYKALQSDKYLMQKVPDNIWGKLEAYAFRASKETSLKYIVNMLNDIALLPQTTNWGGDFLKSDLSEAIYEIKRQVNNGKFPLFMDTISKIVSVGKIDCNEINDFLEEFSVGYSLELISNWALSDNYHWSIRDNIDDLSRKIDETKANLKTVSQQAIEHLEQAKKQLENSENERALKDAVRDCASAMETIIKEYGKKNDIREATKQLRDSNDWGKDEIVKDGDAIFNTLHRLYPDLRHGSTETSHMTLQEAVYWADRITTYINYMIRQRNSFIRD